MSVLEQKFVNRNHGYGLGANTAILANLPQGIQLIFGGSGIVPAALVAIIMNILLPKEENK